MSELFGIGEIQQMPSSERPWKKYYTDTVGSSPVPQETLYECLLRSCAGKEKCNAFIYLDGSFSYGRLLKEIEQAASSFSAIGVKKGDIVACCSLTSPEAAVCLYALNKLGAAMMLLDPRRSEDELRKFLFDGNVRFVVLMDIFYPKLEAVLEEHRPEKIIVSPIWRSAGAVSKLLLRLKRTDSQVEYSDRIISFDKFLSLSREQTSKVGYDAFQLAAITYSSGTTDFPKGIMLSNLTLGAVKESYAKLDNHDRHFRCMSIVPVFASYGLACGLHAPLCLNYEIVMIVKVDPEKIGAQFRRYKPTHTVLVPGFYEKLIESREMKNVDLSNFRVPGCGGDSMSPGLEKRVSEFFKSHGFPYELAQGYGMSEMCSVETTCYKNTYKPGSCGIPMFHVNIGIFEPGTDNELTYNTEGEICASGSTMMLGYLNNPAATEKSMFKRADGSLWIRSGDLGYIDEDGFLFFTGRKKRSIPRPDGHKVAPVQLENVVSRVSNVRECACVGVKVGSSSEGQMPVVAVVLADKALEDQTLPAIWKALRQGVEERSLPMDVYAVEKLPIIGMGKINYKQIAENYMESHPI